MRIAHFAIFAPHASGQYETVKDLILAERALGVNAQFVDCGTDKKGTVREGLYDGAIHTKPLTWALEKADICIRHTTVPKEVYDVKPVIMAMHGRPESSFLLEFYDIIPGLISNIGNVLRTGRYKAVFTFWEEHVYYWKHIHGVKVNYIPAPVTFLDYNINGDKHDFGQFKAGINLMVADMWRHDNSPFNLLFAAQYFQENYHKDTKLHMYGVPVKKKCLGFLANMQKKGVVGEVAGQVGWIPKIYRGADILLTTNIVATRVIREAMACGLPVVAPHGCRYTPYTAEPRDYKAFAAAINDCYNDTTPEMKENIYHRAKEEFNSLHTAQCVINLCKQVLKEKPIWNAMSITANDWEVLKGFISMNNIKSIVEFGAGVSTTLFDQAGVNVVSYETIPAMVEKTKEKTPNAEFIIWDGKTPPEIKERFDMAFIDGPHGGKNREPSYKAIAESAVDIVACHDAMRQEDRQWIDKYFKDWKPRIGTNDLLILKRRIC